MTICDGPASFAMESGRKTSAWSSAIDTDGSAAQPAPTIATYMISGTAAQPAVQAPTHKLAFYNIGRVSSSKKHYTALVSSRSIRHLDQDKC